MGLGMAHGHELKPSIGDTDILQINAGDVNGKAKMTGSDSLDYLILCRSIATRPEPESPSS